MSSSFKRGNTRLVVASEGKKETGEVVAEEERKDMAWSAESATKAYLQTLKMGKRWCKEPDMSEFVSALAAGNGARLMVEACGGAAGATTLALAAAAQETGGRVICILPGLRELRQSKTLLAAAEEACATVEFVVGDASTLLLSDYTGADFVLIDCDLDDHEEILEAAQVGRKQDGVVVVGYNAFHGGKWQKSMLLPIGDGLQVVTIKPPARKTDGNGGARRSRWVVRVDTCTGEEHVYRITNPHTRQLEA